LRLDGFPGCTEEQFDTKMLLFPFSRVEGWRVGVGRRLHWGIENGFHRCLNVDFREDASAIRLRNAAAHFALLRRFALNLFRLDKRSKKSLPKKRKAAAWNSGYVVDLLNLRPLQEI